MYPHATPKLLAYLGVQWCVNRETAGSIAGFLATAPMTIAMNAMHRALPENDQHPLPPRQITENAAAQAGVDIGPSEETHEAATHRGRISGTEPPLAQSMLRSQDRQGCRGLRKACCTVSECGAAVILDYCRRGALSIG